MTDSSGLLEFNIEDERWDDDLVATCERSAHAALDHVGLADSDVLVSVLLAGQDRIAELNAEFRGKPQPTNVLSWPAEDLAADAPGGKPLTPEPDFDGIIELGDIALCYDTCAREAHEQQKKLADHLSHLTIHGLLHLLGYDHIRDEDAALMERIEVEILEKMGLDDPYIGNESDEEHGPA